MVGEEGWQRILRVPFVSRYPVPANLKMPNNYAKMPTLEYWKSGIVERWVLHKVLSLIQIKAKL